MERIKERKEEAANAKEVKEDIEYIREQFLESSQKRCERIVQDLRVAMEWSSEDLLAETMKKV